MKHKLPRAVCIPFHRYPPHFGDGYKFIFEYFLKSFKTWANEIDRLYIIDSDMNFSQDDIKALQKIKPNTTIWKKEVEGHHWVQFKWVLPKIEEPNILFLDNDVVINKKGIVDGWFNAIENGYDFVGSFDGSGGMHEQMLQFPFIKEHPEFNRMGSYYFILSKNLLEKTPGFDFAPIRFETPVEIPQINYITNNEDWLDSFGLFTIQMLALNPKIKIVEDPRHTVYLQPEGDEWIINKDPETPVNLGYYHIRNGNLANYVITSKISGHLEDYQRELKSNPRELLRSLAWFYHMSDFDGTPLMEILRDLGVRYKTFLEYYDEFTTYHEL